jgi:hypothetical protein
MTEQSPLNGEIIELKRPDQYLECINCPARLKQLEDLLASMGDLNNIENKIESKTECIPRLFGNTAKMNIVLQIHELNRTQDGKIILGKKRGTLSYKEAQSSKTLRTEVECPGLVAENSQY